MKSHFRLRVCWCVLVFLGFYRSCFPWLLSLDVVPFGAMVWGGTRTEYRAVGLQSAICFFVQLISVIGDMVFVCLLATAMLLYSFFNSRSLSL